MRSSLAPARGDPAVFADGATKAEAVERARARTTD